MRRKWKVRPWRLSTWHLWSAVVEYYPTRAMVPDENLLMSMRWLGDLDSNQGFPSQSRKFYR